MVVTDLLYPPCGQEKEEGGRRGKVEGHDQNWAFYSMDPGQESVAQVQG